MSCFRRWMAASVLLGLSGCVSPSGSGGAAITKSWDYDAPRLGPGVQETRVEMSAHFCHRGEERQGQCATTDTI